MSSQFTLPFDIPCADLFVSEPIRWRHILLRCRDMASNWSSTISVMPSELRRRNNCNTTRYTYLHGNKLL